MNWTQLKSLFEYYTGYMDERDMPLMENEYKGYMWYPLTTKRSVDHLENFEVRPDDIFMTSYPKAGSHWMNEIIKLILVDGYPDKINTRKFEEWPLEAPNITSVMDTISYNFKMTYCELMEEQSSPRVIGSHVPLCHVPPQIWEKKARVIYITRGFKDTVASFYNFQKDVKVHGKKLYAGFEDMLQKSLDGKVAYNCWFDHVQQYWDARDKHDFLFITYEEMQKDIRSVIRQVAKHIGCDLTDEAVERVAANSQMKKMKKNHDAKGLSVSRSLLKQVGGGDFMNKGVSGRWKKLFTVEQSELVDQIYAERMKGYEELHSRFAH